MTRSHFNGGQWTEARYRSFVKSALRSASVRWPPRYEVLNAAYVDRRINEKTGRLAKHFQCNLCKGVFPQKDVEVNHKNPVVPTTGFDSWDAVIERMFCEHADLEVLCKPCHKQTTLTENLLRKTNAKSKE